MTCQGRGGVGCVALCLFVSCALCVLCGGGGRGVLGARREQEGSWALGRALGVGYGMDVVGGD